MSETAMTRRKTCLSTHRYLFHSRFHIADDWGDAIFRSCIQMRFAIRLCLCQQGAA